VPKASFAKFSNGSRRFTEIVGARAVLGSHHRQLGCGGPRGRRNLPKLQAGLPRADNCAIREPEANWVKLFADIEYRNITSEGLSEGAD